MIAAAWLMLSSLMYSLQLQTGSFPKPLTAQEERYYLQLAADGLDGAAVAAALEQENKSLAEKIKDLGTVESIKELAGKLLGLIDPDTVIFLPEE